MQLRIAPLSVQIKAYSNNPSLSTSESPAGDPALATLPSMGFPECGGWDIDYTLYTIISQCDVLFIMKAKVFFVNTLRPFRLVLRTIFVKNRCRSEARAQKKPAEGQRELTTPLFGPGGIHPAAIHVIDPRFLVRS
jgi:hypothetical protein